MISVVSAVDSIEYYFIFSSLSSPLSFSSFGTYDLSKISLNILYWQVIAKTF